MTRTPASCSNVPQNPGSATLFGPGFDFLMAAGTITIMGGLAGKSAARFIGVNETRYAEAYKQVATTPIIVNVFVARESTLINKGSSLFSA